MKRLQSEIGIAASPARVWEVLTDTAAMPGWNPFIKSLRGDLREGSQVTVRLEPPGGFGMTFKPRILRADPNRELRWLGRLLMPGLFDGEHYFVLEPREAGTHFVQGEVFRGALTPVMGAIGAYKSTLAGFEEMNESLKRRAESN
jgi:hypothetical protein